VIERAKLLKGLRFVPGVALGGGVALILAGLVVATLTENAYLASKTEESTTQAKVLAGSVSAALDFDDKAALKQILSSLAANPQIVEADIRDAQGRMVARFTGSVPLATASLLSSTEPVYEAGTFLGTVHLTSEVSPLARRLRQYAGIAVLVGMAALLMATLGASYVLLRRLSQDLMEEISGREAAEEALRQSQKMEAIGRLTGGVAHDFNNLLMIASSGLDLMDRAKDPARRLALKDGVRQALARGADLTRQLLAFSRRSPLNPRVVALSSQIDGMRVLLERSLREDIAVTFDVAADLWPVEVDPGQLELAILNIAVNARDAMPSGGGLSLSAINLPDHRGAILNGDLVRISLRDTGQGMPPDVLDNVFEPFFTTKGVGKGTGLGLSQVYGFVRASGGDVKIESAPGAGTTVSILLPRSAKSPSPSSKPELMSQASSATRGVALVVEDDNDVAIMVSAMFEELGWRTERARHAQAALAVLEAGATYDLVLSDTVMPGAMNGIDLLKEISRRWPRLPVILTTGYSEYAAAALAEGCRLLLKPYALDALRAEIDALLAADEAAVETRSR
jgi:signal transduction histidine kinase/CheY-like chemotaxis protein